MSLVKGIKCIGPVFDASGYAEWCRSYILALISSGIPVTIGTDPIKKTGRPITVEGVHPDLGEKGKILESHVGKDIDYNVVISWLLPGMALEQMAGESKAKRIVMTLWETDKLHPSWPKHCSHLDEVWLPGYFNERVFRHSFDRQADQDPKYEKLRTIPLRSFSYPINFDDYDTSTIAKLKHPVTGDPLTDSTYVFYSISQWSERKNFSDLLEAYWAEFSAEEDVVLFLKTYGNGFSESEHQKIQNVIATLASYCNKPQGLPPVAVIRDLLSKKQMLALHKACDCYVSSSRGEGLGLGMIEAGVCGNPVITHCFGEQSSYISMTTGILYNHTLKPVTKMGQNSWYRMDQNWANPDIDDLRRKMRFAFSCRDQARGRGTSLRSSLESKCNYTEVSSNIMKALEISLEKDYKEGYHSERH